MDAMMKVDLLETDFSITEEELKKTFSTENLSIEINDGLEEALLSLNELKDLITINESAKLVELCKDTVIETITGQFGLASMFIETKDGGNVTTTHNFQKGITATDADLEKFNEFTRNNDGSITWKDVRKSGGYDNSLPQKRKEAFKNQEVIIDAYTGKPLPKDGQTHMDHIVSAKEIESNPQNHLFKTPEERAKMATNEKNLAFTGASANQSKGEHGMEEWLSQKDKKTGQTKAEKYEIDAELALKKDSDARKFIKKEITVSAAKKYSKELMQTGGKDAAMMAGYSALGVVLRDLSQAIFVEIHITLQEKGNESFTDIYSRFKNRLTIKFKEIADKWKDILVGSLQSGLTAFISNLFVFIINLVATTLKKFVAMIRAGFVSLAQAAKILINPPEGMTKEEANYQALKILTAGLIGAMSLGLSAAIEKLLQSIPGLQPLMMFPVPFPGKEPRTVSDIAATTLSALIGGLLTTMALYLMDKCRDNSEKEKLHIQLVAQSGVVAQYKIAQTWLSLDEAYRTLDNFIAEFAYYINSGEEMIVESGKRADASISRLADAKNRLKMTLNARE